MSRFLLPVVFGILASFAQGAAAEKTLAGKVLRVPIGNAELSQNARWREVRSMLNQAIEAGAETLVFDINVSDAPGMTALVMAEEVARLKVRTAAYVNPSAVGGGALLALACDEIWMAPGSRIGAVPPAVAAEKDQAAGVQETLLADALARLKGGARSLAKLKGHRVDVAEAFVDRSLGLKVGERVLAGEGELLLLDGDDAAAEVDGQPVLAKGVTPSVEDLAKRAGAASEAVTLTAALFQKAPEERPKKTEAKKEIPNPVAAVGATNFGGKVVVIPVGEEDLMARGRFEFMSRTLERASQDGAEAVIFDLDTPGGLAWDTTSLMMNDLQKLKCRSFAFVNRRALSAGAMIAIATDGIYMAPGGSAGAATPVLSTGAEMGEAERAKMNSAVMSMARSVAKEKGHDPLVIEAMIDANRELIVNGEVISPKGELLTLDAKEAVLIVDGRPLFAKAIVENIDEIKKAEGLVGETVTAEPTFFEHIAIWVTKYAAILILIGIAGGYLEMQTPGFGIFGLVSVCAFGLFFFGHYVAGSLVGHEATVTAALFVIGAILLILEFLVFPGTFVFGAAGFLCVMVALVYTMSAWEPMPPITEPGSPETPPGFDFTAYALGLRNFVIGLIGAIVIIAISARFLPESRLFRRLILSASAGGEIESTPAVAATQLVEVGDRGKAASALRPYGTVAFGDRRLEAVIESGYVQSGTEVRVREVRGTRIVVEPID